MKTKKITTKVPINLRLRLITNLKKRNRNAVPFNSEVNSYQA